jgi:transposase-like protein
MSCPECGSPNTTQVPSVSPGYFTDWHCADCPHTWFAVMPEPPEDYKGNGVFAENH